MYFKLYDLLPKSWLQKIYFYELLLIIGELDGDPRYGITDYFEMLKTRNFGRKSLNEIKEILEQMGLHLGMKVEEEDLKQIIQAQKKKETETEVEQ